MDWIVGRMGSADIWPIRPGYCHKHVVYDMFMEQKLYILIESL